MSSAAVPANTLDPASWVVIPLYNEAKVIAGVITELRTRFPNVVCVDDGSSDGSAAVAEAAGGRFLARTTYWRSEVIRAVSSSAS